MKEKKTALIVALALALVASTVLNITLLNVTAQQAEALDYASQQGNHMATMHASFVMNTLRK